MKFIYKSSNWPIRHDLTEEKVYNCEWNGKPTYSPAMAYFKLKNDSGKEIEVSSTNFISLSDWRKKKLKELGL